jgi:predicted MFS family arabinose efflux permease
MSEHAKVRSPWWIVVASILGLLGCGATTVFMFSVFIKPLAAEFGWSRGEISAALGLSSLAGAISSPFIGSLMDRYGIRAVLIPAIVLFSLATASLGVLQNSILMFYAIFIIIGILGAAQSPLAYAKAVTGWFDKNRGLALGISNIGSGLNAALAPTIAQLITDSHGWRAGYIGVGAACFVVAFPAVVFLLREPPTSAKAQAVNPIAEADLPGVTAAHALRSGKFWVLMLILFLAIAPVQGLLSHAVALLTDRGIPADVAVSALAGVGIITILSGLTVGFCLDRFFGPYVGAVFFAVSLVGMALIASDAPAPWPFIGVLLCGVNIGVELDLIGFYIGRYFGVRSYGAVYGCVFPVLPISVALGTATMGATYDAAHTYTPMLIVFTIMLLVATVLTLMLGEYAYPARARDGVPA